MKNNVLHKRKKRHNRILGKMGTHRFNKPRVQIRKTNLYLYANVIDDNIGKMLKSFDTRKFKKMSKIESVKELSKNVSDYLKSNKLNNVIFDRNGYKYHGILVAFAEGLRNNGINV